MRKEKVIKDRVNKIADYLIEYKCLVREVVEALGLTRGIVNSDLQKHLFLIEDEDKINQVKEILKQNKANVKKGFNNECIIENNIVKFKLENKRGLVLYTIIDKEDLPLMKELDVSWNPVFNKKTKSYYAQATQYLGKTNRKHASKTLFLQKEIMKCYDEGYMVDHINHDTLDNRKENLVVVTNQQNAVNRRDKNSNNKSGYRNVFWSEREKKWLVHLQIDGKNTCLGKFKYDELEQAGKFAEEMREKYYKKVYENAN